MSGCYGNDPEDRHFENILNKHTDDCAKDYSCDNCGERLEDCECGYNEDF